MLVLCAFFLVTGPPPAQAQTYYYTGRNPATPAVNDAASAISCDGDAIGAIRYNTGTAAFEGCNGVAWADIRNGATATLNGITAATAANTIDNVAWAQNWSWNSLAGGNGLALSSNGTAALTGQALLNLSLSGANATGAQTTYDAYLSNTHTGTSTNVGLYASATNGTNNYAAIFANGNVGIGTAAPTSLLYVNGTATAVNHDTTAASGTYKINGNPVVALPDADTTSLAVGYDAVLTQNATGLFNIGIGYYALNGLTSGSYNTAIGPQSLWSIGTTSNNAGIGYHAGQYITGADNIAIGSTTVDGGAGSRFMSGSENIGLGVSSLYNLGAASYNVAIGSNALYDNITGSNNTALGYHSGYDSTGSDNTLLGYTAGSLVTGNSNIIVGEAGNITTGNSNILIGNSLTNTTSTGSNQLDIGDVLYGTMNGTPSLTLAGNLIITGTSAITVSNNNPGTTINTLAKLTGAPSLATIAATSDTSGIIGVVMGGAGTAGSAQIVYYGPATCTFDASGVTAGHYVQISAATAGDCKDAGAALPLSGEIIGIATQTVASGNATMLVGLQQAVGGAASTLNGITAATGSSSINSGANMIGWNWNTLTTGNALTLGSSSLTTGAILFVSNSNTSATTGGAIAASTVGTGTGYAIKATNGGSSNTGYAVYGINNPATNANVNYGGYFETTSTGAAIGVKGVESGVGNTGYAGVFSNINGGAVGNYGVAGTTNATGAAFGVAGSESGAANSGYGVYGINNGTANTGYGGYFLNTNGGYALGAKGSLQIIDSADANYVAFQASGVSTSTTYTLPTAAPTVSGYVLSSTTGGTMSWVPPGSNVFGSTTQIAYNNAGTESGDSGLTYTGTGSGGALSVGGKVTLGLTAGVAAPTSPSLADLSGDSISSPTNGQVLTYNGTNWVNGTNAVPSIVVTANATAQAANIAATTLLTPGASTYYRISCYIVLTRAATTSSTLPDCAVIYTDADSNTSVTKVFASTVLGATNTLGTSESAEMLFESNSGVAVQYIAGSTTSYASSGATTMQYAIHVKLEQMQ